MEQELQARLEHMLGQVRRMASDVTTTQKKMLRITATVRSADGLVTATVGPRGHLIELELDPKIYQRPNSKLLAQTILQTVREAVEQGAKEVQELLDSTVPEEFGLLDMSQSMGFPKDYLRKHDSVVLKAQEDDDE